MVVAVLVAVGMRIGWTLPIIGLDQMIRFWIRLSFKFGYFKWALGQSTGLHFYNQVKTDFEYTFLNDCHFQNANYINNQLLVRI